MLKAGGRAEVLLGFIPVLKKFEGEREELFLQQKEKCGFFPITTSGKVVEVHTKLSGKEQGSGVHLLAKKMFFISNGVHVLAKKMFLYHGFENLSANLCCVLIAAYIL